MPRENKFATIVGIDSNRKNRTVTNQAILSDILYTSMKGSCVYIYIYIYIERERERERKADREGETGVAG